LVGEGTVFDFEAWGRKHGDKGPGFKACELVFQCVQAGSTNGFRGGDEVVVGEGDAGGVEGSVVEGLAEFVLDAEELGGEDGLACCCLQLVSRPC
jgi:hypothetical protein